ncbi:MAG: AraC family transcriptional regulator of adaptative response [Myxococcota bacterium]
MEFSAWFSVAGVKRRGYHECMRNSTPTQALPPTEEMLAAFLRRDSEYDGLFFTGVRTTGIFCRTTCSARKPKPENVEFFPSTSQALFAGYRPCLRCRPLEPRGQTPEWLRPLLAQIEEDPAARVRDRDLVVLGLDPGRVRRWFRRNHGMTFHAYQRARRLGSALEEIREGRDVTSTAFDHGFDSLSGFNTAFARFAGAAPTRSKECPLIQITRILTPLGPMIAAASEEALHLLEFTDRRMLETQLERLGRRTGAVLAPGSNAVLEQTGKELTEYFDGARTDFTVPLEPAGTDFQRGAWTALSRIPFGDTRSYAQQAVAIGRPTAVRAVAKANGDNPIAIVVPCHRVVGSNGKLTGYAGGLHRKQFLLDLERRVAGKETQLSAL